MKPLIFAGLLSLAALAAGATRTASLPGLPLSPQVLAYGANSLQGPIMAPLVLPAASQPPQALAQRP